MWLEARTRRAFIYAEFIQGWRDICADLRLDPADGTPRIYQWPKERQQPCGRPWWADPQIFADPGKSHSTVEAEAFRNLAQQVRFITAAPVLPTLAQRMAAEFRAVVKEALEEDRAARRADLPLRQLHALRGEEVITLEGVRVLVPIKVA